MSTPIDLGTDELDLNRREFRMNMPRADVPVFNGDNPIEWIRKCRYFFEIHQVPERYKTRYASLLFSWES